MNNYDLTRREIQILTLLVQGFTNAEIATKLKITEVTVKSHFKSIYKKLDTDNRVQAVLKIFKEDLLDLNKCLIK